MKTHSSSDLKNKIIESQKDILNAMAEYESILSLLYKCYADIFPATADCWLELSGEERKHADALRSLLVVLERGELFKNLGRFKRDTMLTMMAELRQNLEKARKGELTDKEAISMALGAETSVQDAHFYDIVESDAPEFRSVASRLSSDTARHVQRVRALFTKSTAR